MIQLWYNNQQLLWLTPYKNNTIPPNRHQHLSSPHPLAGTVAASILYGTVHSRHTAATAAIDWAYKEGFCTLLGQRPTQSRQTSHNSHKHQKRNTNSLVAIFLPNPKSNRKYVAVQLNGHPVQLQVDTASDITLISQSLWETIGQPSLTSTSHVAQSASGNGVHITGELPATIKMKEKTVSGNIYIANSSHNLLGLDFIEPLGLLDIPLNRICKVVSSSLPQNNIIHQTKDIMKRFSSVF